MDARFDCIDTALDALGTRDTWIDAVERLRWMLARAPAGVGVHYAGAMLGRRAQPLRVCLRGLTAPQIIPYLDTVCWQGRYEQVAAVLSKFARYADRIVLDLDVGTSLGSKLGIELSFAQGGPAKWRGFMSRLRREALCTIADKQFVLDRGAKCSVNHIKLTCGSSQPIGAKAYLYCTN